MFISPEEIIIKQYESTSSEMFYIIQGDCIVNIIDEKKKEHIAIKLLVEGHSFGEIGAIFNCPRTSTVISVNYSTLAVLGSRGFKDVA